MAEEGPYEIMPYKEIAELKRQIQELKSNTGSDKLLNSINNLTEKMDSLIELFRTAADEMKLEEKDEHFVAKKIEPLIDKLDEIIDQNKTIAEGMVSVAEMVKEHTGKAMERPIQQAPRAFKPQPIAQPEFGPDFERNTPEPIFPGMPPPANMPFPGNIPPPGAPMRQPRHTGPVPMPNMPPPDFSSFEPEKKKRGLFGFSKKE